MLDAVVGYTERTGQLSINIHVSDKRINLECIPDDDTLIVSFPFHV